MAGLPEAVERIAAEVERGSRLLPRYDSPRVELPRPNELDRRDSAAGRSSGPRCSGSGSTS